MHSNSSSGDNPGPVTLEVTNTGTFSFYQNKIFNPSFFRLHFLHEFLSANSLDPCRS